MPRFAPTLGPEKTMSGFVPPKNGGPDVEIPYLTDVTLKVCA